MKALSIKQPWAWLIVNGHKDVENRTWKTSHLGPLAIHAGRKFDQLGYEWVRENFPEIRMPKPADFERGGFVGLVKMLGCVSSHSSKWHEKECWAWVLANPAKVNFYPYKGQLGFFYIEKWADYEN